MLYAQEPILKREIFFKDGESATIHLHGDRFIPTIKNADSTLVITTNDEDATVDQGHAVRWIFGNVNRVLSRGGDGIES